MSLPLEGIVVADLTQNVAGPFCTQILGDMGAEVVKVERPGRGDDARAWAPPHWGEESATFMAFNRNKRSLTLDLKRDGGVEILRRLVRRADVFVQSLHAGAVEGLGLDFAGASTLNPRLVYCSITAFGTEGPLKDRPGYDPLMQAYGGLMSVNGHPGQEPARVGTSIVDMGTGMWAALGIVAALRERDRTGRAVEVTTALFETALMWVAYHAMGYLGTGEVPQAQGSGTAMIVPYQAFPTTDGYAMIAAGSDSLFAKLTTVLGAPELAARSALRGQPLAGAQPGGARRGALGPHAPAIVGGPHRGAAGGGRAERADPLDGRRPGRAPDQGERHAGLRAAPPDSRLREPRPSHSLGPRAAAGAPRAAAARRALHRRADLARLHPRRRPWPPPPGRHLMSHTCGGPFYLPDAPRRTARRTATSPR